MINTKMFDPNNIKLGENLYKNNFIYYWIYDDQRFEIRKN